MTNISSLHSQILDLPPSCIAFNSTLPDYFVVGTYYLHEDEASTDGTQKRTGSLILMKVVKVEGGGSEIKIEQTLPTDYAVLDIQWRPAPEPPSPGDDDAVLSENESDDEKVQAENDRRREILAVAGSTGKIEFFHLEMGSETDRGLTTCIPRLCSLTKVPMSGGLILSLSWSPGDASMLSFTTSNGQVGLLTDMTMKPDRRPRASTIVTIKASYARSAQLHKLEAWTSVFAGTSTAVTGKADLLSGGDDCLLACSRFVSQAYDEANGAVDDDDYDSNDNESVDETGHEVWLESKIHQAGVTAIVPLSERLIVTGSYDESIRLIRLPPGGVGRKEVVAELGLGGGVWRLKIIYNDAEGTSYTFLASCMHAGARIVRLQHHIDAESGENTWRFEVLAKFAEHQSMNYASDVQPSSQTGDTGNQTRTIVSTSFYDKLLCLWHYEPEP